MADALPFFFGYLAGVIAYRWCIGRVARSRGLSVTRRQLWVQTAVIVAVPLAVVMVVAWLLLG